jgi:hypothetical protein
MRSLVRVAMIVLALLVVGCPDGNRSHKAEPKPASEKNQ